MKKVTLLIALMLIMALSVSAVELEPSITGSATVTWGYDLDTEASGFKSETASSFSVTLLEGSETKGADADVYGEITLDGFGVSFSDTAEIDLSDATHWYDSDGEELDLELTDPTGDDSTDDIDSDKLQTRLTVSEPTITAKIVLSPTMSLIIASAPELTNDMADVLDGDDVADTEFSDPTGGVTLEVSLDAATVSVELASLADYEHDYADYEYGYQVNASIAADPATIDVSLLGSINNEESDDSFGIGLKAALDLGMLAPVVAADINIDDATTYEVALDVPVTITDDITAGLSASMAEDGDDATDLSIDLKAEAAATISVATITFDIIFKELLSETDLGIDMNASLSIAATDTITLAVEGGYDQPDVDEPLGKKADLTASVALSMIPNTTITLKYTSAQLMADQINNDDEAEKDFGLITLATVVSY